MLWTGLIIVLKILTSLQDIVDAFKDRYGDPDSSPCAPKIVQQNESNLVKGSAAEERFQDNASY